MANEITATEVTLTRLEARRVPTASPSRGSSRIRIQARYRLALDTATNFNYDTSVSIPISTAFTTDATKLIDSGININQKIDVKRVGMMKTSASAFSPAMPCDITHVVGAQPVLRVYQANGGAAGLHAMTEFANGTSIKGATGFNAAGPHIVEFEVEGELRPGVTLASLGIEE